jgi:hypothetical protein
VAVSADGPLTGGATGATRRGNTVRRPTGSWTPAVHALMGHVRASGIEEVPEVLGVEGNEEILRWIPGDEGLPDLDDETRLFEVGALVRRVGDALQSFAPPDGAVWRLRPPGPAFVHGDISPWNVVRRDQRLVGLLDWDQAGPGRFLEDLAYAACTWVPLESPDKIPSHWVVADTSVEAPSASAASPSAPPQAIRA